MNIDRRLIATYDVFESKNAVYARITCPRLIATYDVFESNKAFYIF